MISDAVLEKLGVAGPAETPAARPEMLVDATPLDTDHSTRGIGRYVRGLLGGLQEVADPPPGHIRLGGPLRDGGSTVEQAPASAGDTAGLSSERVLTLNRPPGTHLTRWILNELKLSEELEGQCALFHSTEPASACVGDGFKSVVTVHDVIPLMFPDVYMRLPYVFWPLYYRWLERQKRWQQFDRIIAISQATRRELQRYLDIPAERITVVYNGIDHDQFAPVDDPAQLRAFREKYGLPARYVLYLGGDDYRKNLDVLVRSLPHLPDDVDLVVAGGAGEATRARLKTLAASMRVADRLCFPGYIDDADLVDLYAAAELFAYPSLAEGFGLQVLEAMAVGCPVAASRVSSLPEIVGDAGLLFDPNDAADVGATLRRALEDDALKASMRQAGFERAAEFSWTRCAEETLAVYEEVLTEGSA